MKHKRFFAIILAISLLLSVFGSVSAQNDKLWDPFNGDKDVSVVFIGGSITEGNGYRTYIGEWLKNTYEGLVNDRKVNCYNAGIGGTGSDYGLVRLNRDVISHNPDLVFVEFAVNDGYESMSEESKNYVKSNMEGIVRNLQSLQNPPMIVFVYTTGTSFDTASTTHHEIAEYYNIPELDFRQYMLDEGYESAEKGIIYGQLPSRLKMLWSDLTHPNMKGHKLWSDWAIGEFEADAKKYFRHPVLKVNPLCKDLKIDFFLDYVKANEAYESGDLSIAGTEGEDFIINKDSVTLKSAKAVASFGFNAKHIAMTTGGGQDKGEATVQVDKFTQTIATNGTIEAERMSFYKFGLSNWGHTLKITPKGNGDIKIFGFFKEGLSYSYPAEYPEGVTINQEVKVETEEVTEEEDYSEYEKYLMIANKLNIISDLKKETPGENLTRAEFAELLSTILQPGSEADNVWYEKVLGDDNDNTFMSTETDDVQIFDDVPVSYKFYNNINIVNNYRLMLGTSDTTFSPDKSITIQQAAVVLMRLMGYSTPAQVGGGYIVGYTPYFSETNVLMGISNTLDELNYATLSRMLFNIYDSKMFLMQMRENGKVGYEHSDVTFSEFFFDISSLEGQVTQTETTTLDGEPDAKRYVVVGYSFEVSDDARYMNG